MNKQYLSQLCVITLLAGIIGIFGCTDDAAGPGDEDPEVPDLPQMDDVEPDLSFFERESEKSKTATEIDLQSLETLAVEDVDRLSESDIFGYAAQQATATNFLLTGLKTFYDQIFMEAEDEDYSYEDGTFVWEYSTEAEVDEGAEGLSASITLKATPNSDETKADWELRISSEEYEFEDEVLMDGTTSYDGSEGEWKLYDIENTNEVVMEMDWSVDEEDNMVISNSFSDPQSDDQVTVSYEEDGQERWLSMESDIEDFPGVSIYWNEETSEGYLEADGIRLCWDENLEGTACSNDSGEEYEGDLPEYPRAEFDFSYFEEHESAEGFYAFDMAAQQADQFSNRVSESMKLPHEGYYDEMNDFMENNIDSYIYEEGVLSWQNSRLDSDGMPSELLLQAEPNSDETEADWSFTVTDFYYDEEVFWKVTVSFDGTEWSDGEFYTVGEDGKASSEPALEFEGTLDDDFYITEATFHFNEVEMNEDTEVKHWEDGSEKHLTIENSSMEQDTHVMWNEETDEGYVETYGDRSCWDENFEDVACEE